LEEGDKGVFEILRKRGQWRRGKWKVGGVVDSIRTRVEVKHLNTGTNHNDRGWWVSKCDWVNWGPSSIGLTRLVMIDRTPNVIHIL
jgi:hypothetical protein